MSAWASIVSASCNCTSNSFSSTSADIARDLAGVQPLAARSSNALHPGTRFDKDGKKRKEQWLYFYLITTPSVETV